MRSSRRRADAASDAALDNARFLSTIAANRARVSPRASASRHTRVV
jgi:hypothetical protein